MKTAIILMCLLISLAGCSTIRQNVIDISNENAENVKTAKVIAEQCVKDWLIISGFIKGVLGNRINELPAETVTALARLDEIAAQTEHTDYELGEFLGLKTQVIGSVVQIIIERYAPNAIEFLPLIF